MSEDGLKRIQNPERILRILRKMSEGRLSVLIRAKEAPEVAVKGRIENLGPAAVAGKRYRSVHLGNVSGKGAAYLVDKKQLIVEFVLSSRKISFETRLMKIVEGHRLAISVPKVLESLERRNAARYKVTEDLPAYLSFENWNESEKSHLMMPTFEMYETLRRRLPLADMSESGGCIASHFPAIQGYARPGMIEPEVKIWLPLQAPLKAKVEIRWMRKTKDNIMDSDRQERTHEVFRIGYQVLEADEGLELALKQFLKQLASQEAI